MAPCNFDPINDPIVDHIKAAASAKRSRAGSILLIACALALPGCTVLALADLAASAVVGTAGLVVDAAVGTAKIGGKVIGKTADVVFGSDPVPVPAP